MQGGPRYLLDTNVVVKFFLRESESDLAVALLTKGLPGTVSFVVLDFLFLEFVNVLWQRVVRGELTEPEGLERVDLLLRMSSMMEIVPGRAVLLEALDMACRYGVPSYDAALLAVAEQRHILLLTADQKLYESVSGRLRCVRLLRDLQV